MAYVFFPMFQHLIEKKKQTIFDRYALEIKTADKTENLKTKRENEIKRTEKSLQYLANYFDSETQQNLDLFEKITRTSSNFINTEAATLSRYDANYGANKLHFSQLLSYLDLLFD